MSNGPKGEQRRPTATADVNPPSPERDQARLLIARARADHDVLDFGMGLEAKIVSALQEASNGAYWQDLWEAANTFRAVEEHHDENHRAHAKALGDLYAALDATTARGQRRESAGPTATEVPTSTTAFAEQIWRIAVGDDNERPPSPGLAIAAISDLLQRRRESALTLPIPAELLLAAGDLGIAAVHWVEAREAERAHRGLAPTAVWQKRRDCEARLIMAVRKFAQIKPESIPQAPVDPVLEKLRGEPVVLDEDELGPECSPEEMQRRVEAARKKLAKTRAEAEAAGRATVADRVWLIRNKSGTFMHWASTERPDGCASDQEIVSAIIEPVAPRARVPEPVLRGSFTCPKCKRSHDRGPLNGVDAYRCLGCGEVTKVTEETPGYYHPDLEIDVEVRKDIAEGEAAADRASVEPERCATCGGLTSAHVDGKCPPRKPYVEACEDIRDLDEGDVTHRQTSDLLKLKEIAEAAKAFIDSEDQDRIEEFDAMEAAVKDYYESKPEAS